MGVLLKPTAFDPYEELRQFQRETFAGPGAFGATATFVGTMRDLNEGDTVLGMYLEHYPGMTERHLLRICESAHARWELQASLVVHRVGEIVPGDPIVLVAVWSAHRAEAFEACRYIVEDLKSEAPFWKKETLTEGSRWVGRNTSGTARPRSPSPEET